MTKLKVFYGMFFPVGRSRADGRLVYTMEVGGVPAGWLLLLTSFFTSFIVSLL